MLQARPLMLPRMRPARLPTPPRTLPARPLTLPRSRNPLSALVPISKGRLRAAFLLRVTFALLRRRKLDPRAAELLIRHDDFFLRRTPHRRERCPCEGGRVVVLTEVRSHEV